MDMMNLVLKLYKAEQLELNYLTAHIYYKELLKERPEYFISLYNVNSPEICLSQSADNEVYSNAAEDFVLNNDKYLMQIIRDNKLSIEFVPCEEIALPIVPYYAGNNLRYNTFNEAVLVKDINMNSYRSHNFSDYSINHLILMANIFINLRQEEIECLLQKLHLQVFSQE